MLYGLALLAALGAPIDQRLTPLEATANAIQVSDAMPEASSSADANALHTYSTAPRTRILIVPAGHKVCVSDFANCEPRTAARLTLYAKLDLGHG